jgi:hypothetical protein
MCACASSVVDDVDGWQNTTPPAADLLLDGQPNC